ncbi:MAG TPA: aminoglycoside/hydroxyurea antibiotic resistance kinase, partial [Chloroflexota bacterium]|nr:aminoglycoside/hydroxyurea antibiotic resistance kinase [Chloroflexota bacterium]
RNPRPVPDGVNRRRLDIFTDRLGLNRDRAKQWLFVHSVLDACWSFEDGHDWRVWLNFAESSRSW